MNPETPSDTNQDDNNELSTIELLRNEYHEGVNENEGNELPSNEEHALYSFVDYIVLSTTHKPISLSILTNTRLRRRQMADDVRRLVVDWAVELAVESLDDNETQTTPLTSPEIDRLFDFCTFIEYSL